MNIDDEIKALDNALYELYRGGSVDQVQIKKLWNRVDYLEDAKSAGLHIVESESETGATS